MLVRFKNADTGNEINIITTNVSYFEPATNDQNTLIVFTDGRGVTVEGTNRSVRHAFKKALVFSASDTDSSDS